MAGPKLLSGLMMVLLIDLIGAMEEHSLEGVDVQDLGTSVHEVALLRIALGVGIGGGCEVCGWHDGTGPASV